MTFSMRSRMSILVSVVALLTIMAGVLASLELRGAVPHAHAAKADESSHPHIDCAERATCTEVLDPNAFGSDYPYVGHDEPSNLFYSNVPGSGNRNLWFLKLPKDPTPNANETPKPGQTFNFELHPAFWFGMAMCDTQSYPEQVSTCTPDSDSNIVDPAVSPNHPGTAFMEMQFYPPGWASWPAGNSCDATQWCAALNIDSLSVDPVNGTQLNAACQAITGLEPVNFAFITKSGVPQAPANPVQSTLATFTPDPTQDLFMNSGDNLAIKMGDTPSGLRIDILDLTTGQHGFMVASAANGFGQVQFAPTGTTCNNIPYDFHPMYSTSSEQTRVPWAAHSYNIAFADETGHFDFCDNVNTSTGDCSGNEGQGSNLEPTDVDDQGCFAANQSLLIQVSGCIGQNNGFDGVPYLNNSWPEGGLFLDPQHPTPIQFSSPLTGTHFNVGYSRSAFEADLPRIEVAAPGSANNCIRSGPNAGQGCLLFPLSDDGTPVPFYPYFSSTITAIHVGELPIPLCVWQIGGHIPLSHDFGKNNQYGSFLHLVYTQGAGTVDRINDFRGILDHNPCQPLALAAVNTLKGLEGI